MMNVNTIIRDFEKNKEQVSIKTLASVVEASFNGYTMYLNKGTNEPFEIVDNETGERKIVC